MKLWSGIALSVSIVLGGELQRPEPFFTPQNTIFYTITTYPKDGNGERQKGELRILTVLNDRGNISSSGVLTFYNKRQQPSGVFRMDFASDSSAYYVLARNWSYVPLDAEKQGSVYTGDSLQYPYNMKVGDTLRNAWTMREMQAPDFSGKFRTEFKNRKVISNDTIDTPFGKTGAFRIEMVLKYSAKYDSNYSGKNKNQDEISVTEWFSPSIGIVKTEYRDSEYGVTKIVMESYKK